MSPSAALFKCMRILMEEILLAKCETIKTNNFVSEEVRLRVSTLGRGGFGTQGHLHAIVQAAVRSDLRSLHDRRH